MCKAARSGCRVDAMRRAHDRRLEPLAASRAFLDVSKLRARVCASEQAIGPAEHGRALMRASRHLQQRKLKVFALAALVTSSVSSGEARNFLRTIKNRRAHRGWQF